MAVRIVGIVQARMGSKRLPGKVMADICGKPLIQYVCERVAKARQLDDWCVAIPEDEVSSKLHVHCANFASPVFLGSQDDVASRLIFAGEQMHADYIVRICADSPLIDPAEIDKVASWDLGVDYDVAQNTFGNTPHGTIAQRYKLSRLKELYPSMDADDREHAIVYSRGIMRAPDGEIPLTVDTQSDLDFIRRVVEKMDRAHWTYDWAACQKIASQLS